MTSDDLEQFTSQVAADMGFGRPLKEYADRADAELELEDAEDEGADEVTDDEAQDEFWSTLTEAEQRALAADEDAYLAAFEEWSAANLVEEDEAAADGEDEIDPDAPLTPTELIGWVYENAVAIRQQFGMTPGEYLAEIVGSSEADWVRWATGARIDPSVRPTRGDLSRLGGKQVATDVLAADFERDLARLQQQGRYIGK